MTTTSPTCTAPGCTRPARAKGLCTTHYRRTLRAGKKADLAAPVRRRDLVTLPGPRVTPECAEALEREAKRAGLPVYRMVGDVLEGWSKRK